MYYNLTKEIAVSLKPCLSWSVILPGFHVNAILWRFWQGSARLGYVLDDSFHRPRHWAVENKHAKKQADAEPCALIHNITVLLGAVEPLILTGHGHLSRVPVHDGLYVLSFDTACARFLLLRAHTKHTHTHMSISGTDGIHAISGGCLMQLPTSLARAGGGDGNGDGVGVRDIQA
ncbi:hypothetical protein K504DRAFT_85851 [Pleomassaria siparia CBS 279.74]|uniref:Uncharacterized protein n=1 Tax=Pleomassaria siparia CBS 279.74 TaxID=1314801 RepID=A0A6G1JZ44_9PLEO|nr:hypothetical protein K504DRAFT_85851 [Pleomassaria siparia CBS 279.74]